MTIEAVEKAMTIPGWLLRVEAEWLYDAAAGMKSILEIGSWMGRSTYVLCSACKGIVVAVDHFLGSPEHQDLIRAGQNPLVNFLANVGHFENLIALKIPSEIAAAIVCMPRSFDMVFIDGAHEYEDVIADLNLWGMRAQTLLCGHDGNYKSIERALAERFPDRRPEKVPGTTLWFYRMEAKNETTA